MNANRRWPGDDEHDLERSEAELAAVIRDRGAALRQGKRDAIVAAAYRVFERRGLEGASMRLIAKEAGCTTGAIYPYFRGKEELYAEVLTQSLRRLRQAIAARVAGCDDAAAAAAASLQTFFDYYQEHPRELALGLYLYQAAAPSGLTPALDHSLNESLLEVYRGITAAIAAAGLDQAPARATAGIAHAVGLLILEQTQRLRLLGADSAQQMRHYLRTALIAS